VRVHDFAQYNFQRELSTEPEMVLIVWQGDQYPSGVYFRRLNVVDHNGNHGEFSEMTKMLLIK